MPLTDGAVFKWVGRKLASLALPGKRSTTVFVSYAREDEQAAKLLVAGLNQRGIENVWFAPRQLQPGDHLDGKIRNAIDRAGYFVVLITQESKNSQWVAKEIERAIEREKERHTPKVIAVYVKSRDIPVSLRDYLGIDLREYAYKAGFEDLVAVLSGEMSPGRTPLDKFERFIKSLPIIDEDVAKAIESLRDESYYLARGLGASESTVNQKLQQVETLVAQKALASSDRQRIVVALRSNPGRLPPCLLESELRVTLDWLRSATAPTLAAASFLYDIRYVGGSRILKSNLVGLIRGWVNRGEVSAGEAPDPDFLISDLLKEKLIVPFKRSEYSGEPDEEFQEFHAGSRLKTVGKVAYLYQMNDPDRPVDQLLSSRYPA
jgi:hypothetical protein